MAPLTARIKVIFTLLSHLTSRHRFLMQAMQALVAGLQGYRPDSIIMDAPRIFHLPKLLPFAVVEGLIIAIGVIAYRESNSLLI